MCKWEATLYRCQHFTLQVTESCVHGTGHPRCLGVEQMLFVLKKHEVPGGISPVLDWCPHKCGMLFVSGRYDEIVARSQQPGSEETDMEMLNKMYLLAGLGEEVKESDYDDPEDGGMSFGDWVVAGLSHWSKVTRIFR